MKMNTITITITTAIAAGTNKGKVALKNFSVIGDDGKFTAIDDGIFVRWQANGGVITVNDVVANVLGTYNGAQTELTKLMGDDVLDRHGYVLQRPFAGCDIGRGDDVSRTVAQKDLPVLLEWLANRVKCDLRFHAGDLYLKQPKAAKAE